MKKEIRRLVVESYQACVAEGLLPEVELQSFDIEQPRDAQNGDYSTNFAMKNVRALRNAPQKIGQMLADKMAAHPMIEKVEISVVGVSLIYLGEGYFKTVAKTAAALGADYGKTNLLNGERIMVEFVSANPTGPMHMGNARGGVVGDSLANALSWAGADVHKEFYVNNAGNQVALFGLSLYTRLMQKVYGEDSREFPENGYHGDDIKVLASDYLAANPDCAEEPEEELTQKLISFGLERNIARMKADLAKYKIHFDHWFLESTLHESGYVAETVKLRRIGAGSMKRKVPNGSKPPSLVAIRTRYWSKPMAFIPIMRWILPTIAINSRSGNLIVALMYSAPITMAIPCASKQECAPSVRIPKSWSLF